MRHRVSLFAAILWASLLVGCAERQQVASPEPEPYDSDRAKCTLALDLDDFCFNIFGSHVILTPTEILEKMASLDPCGAYASAERQKRAAAKY